MSFGPRPWQQLHWDARAAGNFIGGGAGSGLLVFAFMADVAGTLRSALVLLALSLVGAGLLCVWAEIGRPLRAINVLINPRTSWMTREAMVAPLVFGSGAALLGGWPAAWPLLAVAALAFLYCQSRILQAAKGIPAWREPLTVPLILFTGLAEGAGLYWIVAPWWGGSSPIAGAWLAFGVLLALRFAVGALWYRRLAGQLPRRSLAAVNRAGHVFNGGTLLALAITLGVWLTPLGPGWIAPLQALAGALAVLGGAGFKFQLVTRAAFNQGFALPHLPVRGVRR